MPPHLIKLWVSLQSSLWFRPVLFMTLGLLLGLGLPTAESLWPELGAPLRSHWLARYVPTTPDSSREVLIGMAAALVTVMTVAASMTMVTVQLASTQYTPRLLSRFMSDPMTQRVLGLYMLTVVFLKDAFGEIPLAASNQPRVIIRILEVLAQIASVERDEAMRGTLVQTGQAVYEAARLAQQRERDMRLIQERWSELQKELTQPGALPCETIH